MLPLDADNRVLPSLLDEVASIERGEADKADNVLKGAPHSIKAIGSDDWPHAYSRDRAAWPIAWLRDAKFWPFVGRVDNVPVTFYGGRSGGIRLHGMGSTKRTRNVLERVPDCQSK